MNEQLVLSSIRVQELAAVESRQRFELTTLLEGLAESIIIVDNGGHVPMLNEAARAILGASTELHSVDAVRLRPRSLPSLAGRFKALRRLHGFLQAAQPRLSHDTRVLTVATGWQLVIIMADAATLWVLIRALGTHAEVLAVFASFMLANLFRAVGLIPRGLGTFEGMSVLMLKVVGVPIGIALAATLLFRVLSFWLPMPVGFALYQRRIGKMLESARRRRLRHAG
ncbi:MAG: hypothetical protein RL701_4159 [Pseudomonadota bacterium]